MSGSVIPVGVRIGDLYFTYFYILYFQKEDTTMKYVLLGIWILISLPCAVRAQDSGPDMDRTLVICWQHVVCQNDDPCERCINTPLEIQQAFEDLKSSLAGLGITVTYEEKKITEHDEHIYINDRDIIDLIKGEHVTTTCAECLDDQGNPRTCNALKLGEDTYEVIPAELIVKAGLTAASELITAEPQPPCGEEKTPCKGCPYSQ